MKQKATGTRYSAPILVCIGFFTIVLVTACSPPVKTSAPSSQEATKEPTSTLEPTPSPTMTPTLRPSPTITPLGGSGTLLLEILDTSETCVDACPSLGIFSFDIASGTLAQIIDEGYRLEAVSPGGEEILISQSEQLMVGNPSGAEFTAIAQNLSEGGGVVGSARAYWLSGTDTIVFIGQEQGRDFIYSICEDGTDLKRITKEGRDILQLYNPHSNSIIMWEEGISSDAGIFSYGIWRANIDGSNQGLLENISGPTFSPDGDRLAAERSDIEDVFQQALFIMKSDFSDEVQLTPPIEQSEGQFLFSSSHVWIYGGQNILTQISLCTPVCDEFHHYIYSVSGEFEEEVVILHDISYLPSVSPDGLQLAFVSVSTGPVFHSYLVDLTTYEVASLDIDLPDGQMISNMMWIQ